MFALWAATGALVAAAVILPLVYYWFERRSLEARRELEAALVRDRARIEAEALASARDEASRARAQLLADETKSRDEVKAREARLAQREDALDRRLESTEARERAVTAREAALAEARAGLEARSAEVMVHAQAADRALERAAGLTRDEARALLLARLEDERDQDVEKKLARLQERGGDRIESEARRALLAALARVSVEQAPSALVTTVQLPSDEEKLRIVGREGRNVRALEAATGVSVLIDDTPGVVVISAFDPVRRETARRALEHLLRDGRIHPVAVEHAVQAAKEETGALIPRLGEEVAAEARVAGLSPKLIALLGRLEFVTREGQSLRRHALETALLSGAIAGELGVDSALARRAGLLHDVGHAVASEEAEGGHAAAGAEIARREGEPEAVTRAIAGHEPARDEGTLSDALAAVVRLANALSAARPGARSEPVEASIRRQSDLEAIAGSFPGVARAFAVQAGRELRVLVDPGQVTEKAAAKLAKDLARAIEEKVSYPGEVQVTVLRETRVTGTAK